MPRILNIVPVPVPDEALAIFQGQFDPAMFQPDTENVFTAPRAGAKVIDSYYEMTLADFFVLEVGSSAEDEGYDAVAINSMSDSGLLALRSRLNIPVVGSAQAAVLTACLLGNRFSVITMWPRWHVLYEKAAAAQGVSARMASIRDIGVRPDASELLAGKEDSVFPLLEKQARAAIDEDGADVLILGSTTMHQSHAYLSERLEVPVINPGVIAAKLAEAFVLCGLTHSKRAYVSPETTQDGAFR